jgi:hypothetical protein
VRHQRRLDAVARQSRGAALGQGLRRNTQHRLDEIDGGVAPEHIVQALAKTDTGRCRVMHRRGNKIAAAELEEGAMADAVMRRPGQDADRVVLGNPSTQHFAGFVPVDQEHQRSADALQKRVTALGVLVNEAAGDEIEGAVVTEAGRAFAFQPAPLHGEIAEQADEELGARQMHIGVGHRHGIVLDGDDHHMRIGLANIILDGQPLAAACRGRR